MSLDDVPQQIQTEDVGDEAGGNSQQSNARKELPFTTGEIMRERSLEEMKLENEVEFAGESVAAWVGAAMCFGVGIAYFEGGEKAQEFFAGYLLEQSLSVDNLFVFILIFKYFKVWGCTTAKLPNG